MDDCLSSSLGAWIDHFSLLACRDGAEALTNCEYRLLNVSSFNHARGGWGFTLNFKTKTYKMHVSHQAFMSTIPCCVSIKSPNKATVFDYIVYLIRSACGPTAKTGGRWFINFTSKHRPMICDSSKCVKSISISVNVTFGSLNSGWRGRLFF